MCPGGRVDQNQAGLTVAAAMRDFLISKGVPSDYILLEDRSANTYENAVASSKLLKDRGIEQVVLVTDAASLLRAEKCFQRQGVEVSPIRMSLSHPRTGSRSLSTAFVPSIEAAEDLSEAWHEGLGLVWYWLQDRILRPAVEQAARSGDLHSAPGCARVS